MYVDFIMHDGISVMRGEQVVGSTCMHTGAKRISTDWMILLPIDSLLRMLKLAKLLVPYRVLQRSSSRLEVDYTNALVGSLHDKES